MKSQLLLMEARRSWTPPDGLDHSRPRAVRLTSAGSALVVLAIAVVIGGITAGVGLGSVAVREARERRAIMQEALTTQGVVIRLWRSRGDNRQPWVTYRFTEAGRTYQKDARLPVRIWQALRVGSEIPVQYARSRPEINYPYGFAETPIPAWLPGVLGLTLMMIGPLALAAIRRQRKLLSEGRPAPGIVTEHGRLRKGPHGEKLGIMIRYEFQLLSGAIAGGKAGPMKNPPPVGSTITVLYDAENPSRNAPYPLQSPLVRLCDGVRS